MPAFAKAKSIQHSLLRRIDHRDHCDHRDHRDHRGWLYVKTVLAAFILAKQVKFCCELSWLVMEAGSFALACIGVWTQSMNMNIPVNILMNTAPEKKLCAFLI